MRLLLMALILVGCTAREESTPATGGPPPNLQGRWWEYPRANPVDIRGDTLKGTLNGKEFTGVISIQGQQLYILSTGKHNPDFAMVGRYQDYPTVKHFLDDKGLFDMGSDFAGAREPLRVLTLQAGHAPRAAFRAATWKERPSLLKSSSKIQWVSPVSQCTDAEAWKQSLWYENGLHPPRGPHSP